MANTRYKNIIEYSDGTTACYHGFQHGGAEEPIVGYPIIDSITPDHAYNNASVDVAIDGTNFCAFSVVSLKHLDVEISATNIVFIDEHHLTCTFDLIGQSESYFDVVVENPGGYIGTLSDGFRVIEYPGVFLFWCRCDNIAGVPVIQKPEDYYSSDIYPAYVTCYPSEAGCIDTEKQMVGNGCWVVNRSIAPLPEMYNSITMGNTACSSSNRLGFYVYLSGEDFTGDINASVFFGRIADTEAWGYYIRFYSDRIEVWISPHYEIMSLVGTIEHPGMNHWFFVELSIMEPNWEFYINGEEQTITDKLDFDKYSLGGLVQITFWNVSSQIDAQIYVDQIMFHESATKNLYAYRGFDVYTPNIPSNPEYPSDNIIFWWLGEEDRYKLPAVRFYEAEDYILNENGPWPSYPLVPYISEYPQYPKMHICDDVPIGMDTTSSFAVTIYPESSYRTYTLFKNDSVDLSNGFSLGFWAKLVEPEEHEIDALGINLDNALDSFTFGLSFTTHGSSAWWINTNLSDLFLEVTDLGNWHFYQAYANKNNNTWAIKQDTTIIGSGALVGTETFSIDRIYLHGVTSFVAGAVNSIQNLMISSDPTIDFYENGYYLLNEYPKSGTFPEEDEEDAPTPVYTHNYLDYVDSNASNYFYFITYDGVTENTYETTLEFPDDEEEHFLEYSYDLPGRLLRLRLDSGEWHSQAIDELPQNVRIANLKYYIEKVTLPTDSWVLWYSADANNLIPSHDYCIDPSVTEVTWVGDSCIDETSAKIGVAGFKGKEEQGGYLTGSTTTVLTEGIKMAFWVRLDPTIPNGGAFAFYAVDRLAEPTTTFAVGLYDPEETGIYYPVAMAGIDGEFNMVLGSVEIPKDNTWHWIEFVVSSAESKIELFMDEVSCGENTIIYTAYVIKDFMFMSTLFSLADLDQFFVNSDPTFDFIPYRDMDGKPE